MRRPIVKHLKKMKGEVFSKSVLEKIKETLMRAGVPDVVIEQVDVLIYLILILLVAFVVGRMLHAVSTSIIAHLQKRKNVATDTNI